MIKNDNIMGKMYAREASRRVKEKLEADRREQERKEREQQSHASLKHAAHTRKSQVIDTNAEAAEFAAKQRKINLERKVKRQQELLELQQKLLEEHSREDAKAEERRLRAKEKQKNDLRRKSEEHKRWFEAKEDHQLAAMRARKVQRDRPDLLKRSPSVNEKEKKELKKNLSVDELPGTKEALRRIRKFRQEEKAKKEQEEQRIQELRRSKSEHRKDMVKNLVRKRAKSRTPDDKSCNSFGMLDMEDRIKGIKDMISMVILSSPEKEI
ncbi:uncharacterized protein LOC135944661 [Cloeon dipterum]|uniref:uncharacterized protein LOC135944661 n=1 Tax=Cloeon dipterum TaxID=197152 RepID=UPI00321F92C2